MRSSATSTSTSAFSSLLATAQQARLEQPLDAILACAAMCAGAGSRAAAGCRAAGHSVRHASAVPPQFDPPDFLEQPRVARAAVDCKTHFHAWLATICMHGQCQWKPVLCRVVWSSFRQTRAMGMLQECMHARQCAGGRRREWGRAVKEQRDDCKLEGNKFDLAHHSRAAAGRNARPGGAPHPQTLSPAAAQTQHDIPDTPLHQSARSLVSSSACHECIRRCVA